MQYHIMTQMDSYFFKGTISVLRRVAQLITDRIGGLTKPVGFHRRQPPRRRHLWRVMGLGIIRFFVVSVASGTQHDFGAYATGTSVNIHAMWAGLAIGRA